MPHSLLQTVAPWRRALRRALIGSHVLAFLPALALGAFWLGGEPLLLAVALGVPVVFALAGGFDGGALGLDATSDTDLMTPMRAAALADQMLHLARDRDLTTACLLIELDGLDDVTRSSGERSLHAVQDLMLIRLRNLLRNDDRAARIGDARYMVMLAPAPRLDLESLLQLSKRLQSGLEDPASVAATTRYFSASIGFCSNARLPETASGERLIDAAAAALADAVANGPSAIRSWSESLCAARSARATLRSDASRALENGQIQPWYQPQVCTSTGRVSGVEALARWVHPDRGVVAPAQFLSALEEDRRMERLSEVVIANALTSLRNWDRAGCHIPRVSVNFSTSELRNPKLVDKIAWELDRYDLGPDRLGVEILETVIADAPDGVIADNIRGLAALGCHIDLDDFGVGHASISALRRFPVQRLKIDRSFVTRLDRDEDQRRMVGVVLSMADRLGIETLAEGVESSHEHTLLAQLGCDHVQGFGIARPMPADQIPGWVAEHQVRIDAATKLGRHTS